MKGKIAALIAGIILGTTGVASASGHWWFKTQGAFDCAGSDTSIDCKLKGTPWSVFGNQGKEDFISVFYGKHAVFSCNRYDSPADCLDFRGLPNRTPVDLHHFPTAFAKQGAQVD